MDCSDLKIEIAKILGKLPVSTRGSPPQYPWRQEALHLMHQPSRIFHRFPAVRGLLNSTLNKRPSEALVRRQKGGERFVVMMKECTAEDDGVFDADAC